MRAKIPDVFKHGKIDKLMRAHPSEVVYQWTLAYEYIYHVGISPKGGLDDDLGPRPPYPPNTLSDGYQENDITYGLNRTRPSSLQPIDPLASLGVRHWVSGPAAVDPIYGEPLARGSTFPDPPNVILGYVEYDEKSDRSVTSEQTGLLAVSTARMTIPYLHFLYYELKPPKIGDLVEFWADSWETLGIFFDVVKVSRDGFINDSNFFVQWVLELSRRSDYPPEQRLLGCPPGGI